MASGKSTIGEALAKRLDLRFVDTDDEVESSCGMTIAEIFGTLGEPFFREEERAAILRVLDQQQVIAVGGGAFVDPLSRAELKASAHTIWLDPPFELIRARLGLSSQRPLAAMKTDEQLRELWAYRRSFYAQADVRIDVFDDDPTVTVGSILELLARS